MIKLPRLYSSKGVFMRPLNVISASVNLNMKPLSTASLRLRDGDSVPIRGIVEVFTPYGSAGMFRATSPNDAYGADSPTVELEHMITEVGDYLVKEEYKEMIAAKTAMTKVFSHYKGSFWTLGSVSALGSGKIALQSNYDRVLDTMLAILDQVPNCMMTFDFSTSPKWTVNFVKKSTTVTAECRLSRNVTSAQINYDDTELCTRAYYGTYKQQTTNGKKETKTIWKYKDAPAENKSKYGLIERTVSTSSDMTDAEIATVVDNYIAQHKDPRVSVKIDGIELRLLTGESMDKFEIGKLLRLNIPEDNLVVEENIHSLSWGDVYNNPERVTINIGDEQDTVITFLHNLDSKGSGGGGGGKKKKKEDEWKEYQSHWVDDMDDYIGGYVQRIDKQGKILEKAGLDINSKGVLIYSTQPGTIGAKMNVLSNQISLVVTGEGENAHIKPASIVAAINNGSSSVKISADHIELDGETVASFLQGEEIQCGSLECARGGISVFDCDNRFTYLDFAVSWKSFTYQSLVFSASHDFKYGTSGSVNGQIVTGKVDKTIYYLGR